MDLETTLVTVSNRNKKLIIWNFMEELCEYYEYAVKHKIDTQFKFQEFYNIGLLSKFLKEEGIQTSPTKMVVDILITYATETGYISVQGDIVSLTEKGLAKYKKPHHDWG